MISKSPSSRQRILVRAAYYSFYIPLLVLLALLLLLTLAAPPPFVMRTAFLLSLCICATSFLAGLTSMLRIFHCGIDKLSFLALIGMALGFGVGFISYAFYDFPSC